ncbi:hypothetical protein ACF0H5_005677 [Mactra antiquata]
MDPHTEQLIERTRQRRALLNQKMGKTPDPAPRKRVLEDTTNVLTKSPVIDDDSPKRHCVRSEIKADTPAIPSVKSRLNQISEDRMNWSDIQSGKNEVPVTKTESESYLPSSPISRKSRFAKLAQNLNDFEVDMSHPTIRKEEEKKQKWQPPKRDEPSHDVGDRHVSSPKKEYESYQGPVRGNNMKSFSPAASPKKNHAPAPPVAPPVPQNLNSGPPKPPRAPSPHRAQSPKRSPAPCVPSTSPKVSTRTVQLQQPQLYGSPKYAHQIRRVADQVPVNRPAEDSTGEEPTCKPVNERLSTWKQVVDTPNKEKCVNDPTELPLSARFADWEQRVSQTPKTPAGRVCSKQNSGQVPKMRSTDCDDNVTKSVADVRANWKQQDVQNNPPKESEPTAFSVTDRMSAWEAMSSSNQVSYIKKVDPGSSPSKSPTRTGSNLKPSITPNKGATWKPSGSTNKPLTSQKSFKECIEEKAAEMGKKTVAVDYLPPKAPNHNSPIKKTPSQTASRSPGVSPSRVGSATKSLQQKLFQPTKTDKIAEKIREERMAEVNALNNRYHNGILKDDRSSSSEESTCPPPPPPHLTDVSTNKHDMKTSVRNKVREDDTGASYRFDQNDGSEYGVKKQPSNAGKKGSSIYHLVSKKDSNNEQPQQQLEVAAVRHTSSSSLKKVQFKELDSSIQSDSSDDRLNTEDDTMDDFDPQSEETQSETQESFDDSYNSGSESSIPESYKSPSKRLLSSQPIHSIHSEDDDISMSAFVPESVRRESMIPIQRHDETSELSEKSLDYGDTVIYNTRTRQIQSSTESTQSDEQTYEKQLHSEDDDEDECNEADMDDLLDEAIDEVCDVEMRKKEPHPAPRKRHSYMTATTDGDITRDNTVQMRPKTMPLQYNDNDVEMRAKSDGLAYSVSMYRNHRSTTIKTTVDFRKISQEIPVNKRISRNSHYTQEHIVEEDIKMPTQVPPDVQRKVIHEKIQELQELVNQEQSVIMQTSNALNKCCSGDSQFAGSAEQVECNRLLLISCQRRQAYLTEIQRLKETRQLESNDQPGPKGSLTISDIRLPLKKDFVTKIGTGADNTVHYFMILIRNGAQVICTQMLSTHDPMMRGSLDFPNLIKLHGISSKFNINLEIYSMSVSREMLKDKKKKTPKKSKYHTHMPLESPGGPTAVRTTSFTLITSLPITMKSLDKSSFNLDRIPFLSPLHGMIYMRLKCMMEQNVEERGFLTMFEDVSGLGAWHRRWCLLGGNKLCYWKYPDDETRKDPIGFIDLKRVITEKVGLIPRDICARPNTFELVSIRPPRKGEQDTLVTRTYNTMTTTRYMLTADTKEERIVWCNKLNKALANLRTWHADAMRPIKSSK